MPWPFTKKHNIRITKFRKLIWVYAKQKRYFLNYMTQLLKTNFNFFFHTLTSDVAILWYWCMECIKFHRKQTIPVSWDIYNNKKAFQLGSKLNLSLKRIPIKFWIGYKKIFLLENYVFWFALYNFAMKKKYLVPSNNIPSVLPFAIFFFSFFSSKKI